MKPLPFNPFPRLSTDRLELRQLADSDDEAIFLLRSDDLVNTYLDRKKDTTLEDSRAFIKKINEGIAGNQWIYWAITLKDQPNLVGTICLWNFTADNSKAEIGYELIPQYQGKGYMHEALDKIIQYAFHTLRLDSLDAYTHKQNRASSKLIEKHSFKADPDRKDPENADLQIYTLHKNA